MSLPHVLDEISQGNFAAALLRLHQRMVLQSDSTSDEFLIRSDLLNRLGHTVAGLTDIERALLANPLNPRALLRACQSGLDTQANARLLLASRTATQAQRQQALPYVQLDDARPLALPQLFATHICLTICASPELLARIIADTPLGDRDRYEPFAVQSQASCAAADLLLALPPGGARTVSLYHGGEQCFSATYASSYSRPAPHPSDPSGRPADLAIVIPIHNGGDTVARCLDSVLAALPRKLKTRIVLVDDASHDKATRKLLDKYAEHPKVRLIRHETNQGFVRAINSALRQLPPGPVLLLNSDTYVPTGTLKRLMAHLDTDQSIGTVTPFSNNGGSFSLPRPRTAFDMPTPAQCDDLAHHAYALNAGKPVDMLHGNGFAMLISGPCRARIGLLSQAYEGGYYEEVDYCLRARAAGFRNVCATDSFVGHIGSLSYGAAKRSLAAANLELLERTFSSYRAEFDRQVILDPLKPARDAIMGASAWNPTPIPTPDLPLARSIQLPSHITINGQDRLVMPVWGPISSPLLNRTSSRIHWIDGPILSSHGLAITLSHSLRAIFGIGDSDSGTLALLDGERPLASLSLSVPMDTIPPDALQPLEALALRSIEAVHDRV